MLIFHTESILGRRFAKERPRLFGTFNSGFLPISASKYVLRKSLPLSHTATRNLSWQSLKIPKGRINNWFLQAQYELHLPLRKSPAANLEHQPFLGHIPSNYTQLSPSAASAFRNFPLSMDRAGKTIKPAPKISSLLLPTKPHSNSAGVCVNLKPQYQPKIQHLGNLLNHLSLI